MPTHDSAVRPHAPTLVFRLQQMAAVLAGQEDSRYALQLRLPLLAVEVTYHLYRLHSPLEGTTPAQVAATLRETVGDLERRGWASDVVQLYAALWQLLLLIFSPPHPCPSDGPEPIALCEGARDG